MNCTVGQIWISAVAEKIVLRRPLLKKTFQVLANILLGLNYGPFLPYEKSP
jgi:hypothetical protein